MRYKLIKFSTFVSLFLMVNVTMEAQYACGTAVNIASLPYVASNLATSDANYFAAWAACDDEVPEEAIYLFKYTPTVDENLSISINSNANRDAIFAFANCSMPLGGCLVYEEGDGGSTNAELVVIAGVEYFIVIASEEVASFDINIMKEEVLGVAINKAAPTQSLDVNGSIRIGEGTTTPYEGTMRWNTNEDRFQGYDGSEWTSMSKISINDLQEGQYDNSNDNLFLGDIQLLPTFNSTGNATENIAVGDGAGVNNLGRQNTFLGSFSGVGISGDDNVFIGRRSGSNVFSNSSNRNVVLGAHAGFNAAIGDGNVLIGFNVAYDKSPVFDDKLYIDNNNQAYSPNSKPLIYGDFADDYLLVNRTNRIDNNEVFGVSGKAADSGIYVDNNGLNSSPRLYYGFSRDGTEMARMMYQTSNNRLFITYTGLNNSFRVFTFDELGSISQPGVNAYKGTAGSWLANSDRRLKKNITHLDSNKSLQKLLQMKGVEFEWDDDVTKFKRPEGKQIGFIAQELQEVWPEKITEGEDGYLMAAYGDYDPVFVESIKALNDKIETQEETIELLLEKIAAIEKQLISTASAQN